MGQSWNLKGSSGLFSPQPRGAEDYIQWGTKGGGNDQKGDRRGGGIFEEGGGSLQGGRLKSKRKG